MKTNTSKTVKETYKNPLTWATNSIRHFVADGKHVVVHSMTCGEDIAPNAYRFDDISAARNMWLKLREVLAARGYTERVG
jgi:hypothetical protein